MLAEGKRSCLGDSLPLSSYEQLPGADSMYLDKRL
jgi:hypothetical protein